MKAASRIEIRRGRTGLFRFVIIAGNGEIVCTSETYTSKAMCKKGINTLASGVYWPVVDTTIKEK